MVFDFFVFYYHFIEGFTINYKKPSAGLMVLASDTITKETNNRINVTFLSITIRLQTWAKKY